MTPTPRRCCFDINVKRAGNNGSRNRRDVECCHARANNCHVIRAGTTKKQMCVSRFAHLRSQTAACPHRARAAVPMAADRREDLVYMAKLAEEVRALARARGARGMAKCN